MAHSPKMFRKKKGTSLEIAGMTKDYAKFWEEKQAGKKRPKNLMEC